MIVGVVVICYSDLDLINFLYQVKNRQNTIPSIFIVQVISKPNTDTT